MLITKCRAWLLLALSGYSIANQYIDTVHTVVETIGSAVNSHKLLTGTVFGALGFAGYGYLASQTTKADNRAIYFDWDQIYQVDRAFFAKPAQYLKDPLKFVGAGTSHLQVEGDPNNLTAYGQWQIDAQGNWRVKDLVGDACGSWERWKDDIDCIVKAGLGVYRFSIDWAKVEPAQGQFDQAAIDHYKEMVAYAESKGIKLMIGFHHYTDPHWFLEKGGFTKIENIHYFVRFCVRMVSEIGHAPGRMWATFNSPTGYVFHSYHIGDFPPGVKGNLQLTMEALKNVLEAHVQAYKACKQVDQNLQIGICKNIMLLDPSRPWHLVDNIACKMGDRLQNGCMFDFFTKGEFSAYIPGMVNVKHTNPDAPASYDLIFLNHYSHRFMKGTKERVIPAWEPLTQNENYTVYPEGMYRAIKLIHDRWVRPLKDATGRLVPVVVAENGTTDFADPNMRKLFFERTMYSIWKAAQEGYPIEGYIYWSLLDNYEWGSWGDKNYGLYKVDKETKERTLKDDSGTQWYVQLAHDLQRAWQEQAADRLEEGK